MPELGRSPGEGLGYPFSGFPGGSDGEESSCNVGDLGLIPGLRRSPWRRAWQSPPGKSHGQRSLGASQTGLSDWHSLTQERTAFRLGSLSGNPVLRQSNSSEEDVIIN